MKKFLLLSAIICAYGMNATFAQTNLNLEAWTPLTGGFCTGENPDGWATLNVFTCLTFPESTFKDSTDPGEGTFSARLETILAPGAVGAGACSDTAGGMLSIGTETPGGNIGIPYTQKPVSVDFLYKYMPMGNDTGAIIVTLSHRDPLLDTIITDGQGFMLFTQLDTPWTTASVMINWFTADTPDTLAIIASSSAVMFCNSLGIGVGEQRAGTKLWLDDFSIVLPPCPAPTAGFTYDTTGLVVNFTNTSTTTGTTNWTWTFGDAGIDNTQSPSHTYTSASTYNVCVALIDSCGNATFCDSITVTGGVGISELFAFEAIKVYPNPAVNELNIVTAFNGEAAFDIFDIVGRQIKSVAIKGDITKVSIAELPEGMYLYQIVDRKGTSLAKGKFNIVR